MTRAGLPATDPVGLHQGQRMDKCGAFLVVHNVSLLLTPIFPVPAFLFFQNGGQPMRVTGRPGLCLPVARFHEVPIIAVVAEWS